MNSAKLRARPPLALARRAASIAGSAGRCAKPSFTNETRWTHFPVMFKRILILLAAALAGFAACLARSASRDPGACSPTAT